MMDTAYLYRSKYLVNPCEKVFGVGLEGEQVLGALGP